MYERFTDRVRKVMQLASKEAQQLNHEYIGTEHILLGLIVEDGGVAARALKSLNIDSNRILAEIERIVVPGPGGDQVALGRLPPTPRAKKVIELAVAQSRRLRDKSVGTEHILLSLLEESEGVAAQVLINCGLNLQVAKSKVLELRGILPADVELAAPARPSRLRRFIARLIGRPPEPPPA